jgi:hypothetical protein
VPPVKLKVRFKLGFEGIKAREMGREEKISRSIRYFLV